MSLINADSLPQPALPLRAGTLPLAELIDLYMQAYTGADPTRIARLTWWKRRIGGLALQDLTDDHVHVCVEELASTNATYYAGRDQDGRPVMHSKRKRMAPATVNRYVAALGAALTWAQKRRIAPKGWVHPCRTIERLPENNERTRFLSDAEVLRLLQACRASTWPRLYALVLAALSTGARKGELTGLRWEQIDLDRGEARLLRTKNGEQRVLPLVPALVAELRQFVGKPGDCVFCSPLSSTRPYSFTPRFDEALKAAKIKDVTLHTLRHSCASALARNGATLLEIAQTLGHRQMQTTKRYSHLATSHKAALVNRVFGNIA